VGVTLGVAAVIGGIAFYFLILEKEEEHSH